MKRLVRLLVKVGVCSGPTWNCVWALQIGFTRVTWLRTLQQRPGDGIEILIAAPVYDERRGTHVRRRWAIRKPNNSMKRGK